jgi:hypothetical protein
MIPKRSGRRTCARPSPIGAACIAALLLAAVPAEANGPAPPGLHHAEWHDRADRSADAEPEEFGWINYFFTRMSYSNVVGDPSGLRGVSLGPYGLPEGGGSSVATGLPSDAFFIEQRWIPVLSYAPDFADGLATFRAQFEVDYMWGLAANVVQNNQGGGFNADQVNIQTKNVNVALYPTRNPYELSILIGTQSVYDSIYDPTVTSLFDIIQTGYKLSFMGTDATGLSVFARTPYGMGKAAFIPIGAGQPNKAAEGDPSFEYIYLMTLDYAYEVQPTTVVGASYWRLQDNGKGAPFAYQGLVKSGPSSGGLSAYNGTAPFAIDDPEGGVNYLGVNFHHDLHFRVSDWSASGFFMFNFGRYESSKEDTQRNEAVDVSGFAGNLELRYKWGFTNSDVITLEGMISSGDDDPTDDQYSGPFTMNYYGLPGAVWFNHKTLLLFPFTNTVGNYTGAVTDISNQGFGLGAGILTAAWDLIPNTLNLKLGTAYAQSAAQPTPVPDPDDPSGAGIERGKTLGLEVNAELTWHLRYLMTIGLHGGYLMRGDFYENNPRLPDDPWAMFTTFTWYAF